MVGIAGAILTDSLDLVTALLGVVVLTIFVMTGDTVGIAHTMAIIIGTMDIIIIMAVATVIDGTDRIETKETLIMVAEQELCITILMTKIVLDNVLIRILRPTEEMIRFQREVEVVRT